MKSLWSCAIVLAGAGFGCSSSVDASIFDEPAADAGGGDVSSDTTTAGGDTGVAPGDTGSPTTDSGAKIDTGVPPTDTGVEPTDTRPPLSLDTLCADLADAICTGATDACCTKRGVTYAEAGCRTGVLTDCGARVAEVKAGTRTFEASKFAACADAWRSLTSTCSVPLLTFLKEYAACDAMLNGKVPPDGSCTVDTDCHASAGAYANCRSATGRCENILIVGKDSPCEYFGSTKHYCDYGLFCATGGGGGSGVCKPARPPGASCGGPSDTSCGFGNTCLDGKCSAGAGESSSCSSNLECASWNCTAGGICSNPNVEMGSPSTCSGTPG